MTHIVAENVAIEFPLYQTSARSFKNRVLQAATGGVLARSAKDVMVVRALEDINLELKAGDRLGLLGHNGSGKTTLLRVFSGVYAPIQGRLTVEGRIASMLNITLGLDGEATGMENIYLRGTLMGYTGSQMKAIIKEICDFSELGEFIHMPLRTYSSGMSMRLAFAISTLVSADIILMDEWLSVGDAAFSVKAQERIHSIIDKAGIMVLASHDRGLIERLCNKTIELQHGRVIARTNI
jgi:lipopolysaccharide transport system ATP-binding protein